MVMCLCGLACLHYLLYHSNIWGCWEFPLTVKVGALGLPSDLTTSLPRQGADSYIAPVFKSRGSCPWWNVLLWPSEWTNLTFAILWHQSPWNGARVHTCTQAWKNAKCSWSHKILNDCANSNLWIIPNYISIHAHLHSFCGKVNVISIHIITSSKRQEFLSFRRHPSWWVANMSST